MIRRMQSYGGVDESPHLAEDILRARPCVRVLLQQPQDQVPQLKGHTGPGRHLHLRLDDLQDECALVTCLEGMLQGGALEQGGVHSTR